MVEFKRVKNSTNYFRAKILYCIFRDARKIAPEEIAAILSDDEKRRHFRRLELNKEPIPRILFDRALQMAATYSIEPNPSDLRLASRKSKYD
jgi:hypothetical protein